MRRAPYTAVRGDDASTNQEQRSTFSAAAIDEKIRTRVEKGVSDLQPQLQCVDRTFALEYNTIIRIYFEVPDTWYLVLCTAPSLTPGALVAF